MKFFKTSTHLIAALAFSALLISSVAIAGKKSSGKTEVKKEQKAPVADSKDGSKAPATTTKVTEEAKKVTASKSAELRALLRQHGTTPEELARQMLSPEKLASTSAQAGEQINWQVLSGGGGTGSSASFQLTSVVGQTAVGFGSSASYNLNHGFLQDFGGGGGCCANAGDADGGGSANIGDVTFLVAFIFSGGGAPSCCEEGDADGGGSVNIGDVTFLVAHIFSGGAAPVCGPPGMSCSVS